ncbi:DUF7033 domain-containing protein, partial [Flavitalea flava]
MEVGAGKLIPECMLLYTPHITPRLRYIVDFIGKELFDSPIVITTDREEFSGAAVPRLNYSQTEIAESDFFIRPVSLLFESHIEDTLIECFELNYHKAFYETAGDFPFDIFAASFYLLSRYEEYLPHSKDEFGRFAHDQSLAFREGFLGIPLINIWMQEFKKALIKKHSGLNFRYPSFKFIPTYDIDIAYSYLHKGWKRNVFGLLRSLINGDWYRVKERGAVLL